MTGVALRTYVSDLFRVMEINAAGVVPTSSCVEVLCDLNVNLTREMAETMMKEVGISDQRDTDRNTFITVVLRALEGESYQGAISVLRGTILRHRLAYRKKYVMMDIGANTPIPSLTENPTAVTLFKELFFSASQGAAYITRLQLEELARNILPDSPSSAGNLVKAALSKDESDMIGFYEFITVMLPVTSRQTLSEIVGGFRSRRGAPIEGSFLSQTSSHSIHPPLQSSVPVPPVSASAEALPSTTPVALDMELQMSRRWDAGSGREFVHASSRGVIDIIKTAPSHDEKVMMNGRGCKDKLLVIESELVRLRRENDCLRQDLLLAQMQKPSLRIEEDGRIVDLSGDEFFNRENALLRQELAEVKDRFRVCQAANDLHSDMTSIATLLLRGASSADVLRSVYPEESALSNRHRHLVRMIAKREHDICPPGSAARLLLTQLDVLVQGYQALYRGFRESIEMDGVSSARSYTERTSSPNVSGMTVRSLRPRRPPWVD